LQEGDCQLELASQKAYNINFYSFMSLLFTIVNKHGCMRFQMSSDYLGADCIKPRSHSHEKNNDSDTTSGRRAIVTLTRGLS